MWLMVPVAFLVFSWRQYENMLWGFQLGCVLVVLAALAALLGLSRVRSGRYAPAFCGAALAATVAAYSSIQGLLVWPVGLGQLLIAPLRKRLKIILTTLWAALGAMEWLVYFLSWRKPEDHPTFGFSWRYFLTVLGGSLSGDETRALAAGSLILVLAAVAVALVFFRRQWTEQSFWLATIVLALGTLGAITIGRSGLGVEQAVASRYATFSVPLVVATYAIFASQSAYRPSWAGMSLTAATLLLMVLGPAFSFGEGWQAGQSISQFRRYQQFVLCTIDMQPDSTIHVFPPSVDFVRQYAALAKKLKYNLFADPDLCGDGSCPIPRCRCFPTKRRAGCTALCEWPTTTRWPSAAGPSISRPATWPAA